MNMSLKALITTLVIGSSSVALAAPAVSYGPTVRDHRDSDSRVSDHRNAIDITASADIRFQQAQRPVRPMPPVYTPPVYVAPTWVTLANDMQVNGRTSIKVAPTARQFTKLELRAEQGNTSIDKVMIVFGNGRSQVVDLKTKLGKRDSSISIDLNGNARSIERIVLVGRSNGRRASLDVLAI
jgi:hypothetical protein